MSARMLPMIRTCDTCDLPLSVKAMDHSILRTISCSVLRTCACDASGRLWLLRLRV